MESLSPRTYQKALQINLDLAKYGTFAEIGAGQEVAGWFFHEHYVDLPGGLLEGAGRLFRRGVKVYVHPYQDPDSSQLVTAENLPVAPDQQHLLAYLRAHGCIEPIRDFNAAYLPIRADDVLSRIAAGDRSWEAMVPPAIVRTIKRDGLFGWQPAGVES